MFLWVVFVVWLSVTSIWKTIQPTSSEYPEGIFLWNVGNHVPDYMMSLPTGPWLETVLLWKPKIPFCKFCKFLGKWPAWHTILFYIFISIFYMFRATSCSSSGESVVSIQPLVYVSDLHAKWSLTQSDIYQRLYWYNWFSW